MADQEEPKPSPFNGSDDLERAINWHKDHARGAYDRHSKDRMSLLERQKKELLARDILHALEVAVLDCTYPVLCYCCFKVFRRDLTLEINSQNRTTSPGLAADNKKLNFCYDCLRIGNSILLHRMGVELEALAVRANRLDDEESKEVHDYPNYPEESDAEQE